MAEFTDRQVLEEVARRAALAEKTAALTAAILGELYDKQRAFVEDKSRNKAALCTRRAGKTMMWPRYCTVEALRRKCLIRIWGINRLRAKQLLWKEFKELFERHKLTPQMHETELTITFANGSEIRLLGADKAKEAQKKRGDKTAMEVVLEAQLFGGYLRTLVEDIAEPCLFDMQGTFCLEGTPGPVCGGYWFCITGDAKDGVTRWVSEGKDVRVGDQTERVGAGWSCHRWGVLDNPFLPHAREELALLMKKRKWTAESPTYLREWKALWVTDLSALFYAFDELRNTFTLAEVQPWGPGWMHSLGWDLGSRDDMALVVWAWHPTLPYVYEAFSWKKKGALSAEIMGQIETLEKRGFNIVKKAADTQGGGKMFVEEVMSRYSQVFEAAKKGDKYGHVQLFNEDLRRGFVKLQRGSELAEEMAVLTKDPDWIQDLLDPKPPPENPGQPNHACFIAGTLVETARGAVPIEQVRVGDLALTREGYRPVVQAAPTGVKPILRRLGLTGTADHPIWTENRGWVRLDSVVPTDQLCGVPQPPSAYVAEDCGEALVYALTVADQHEYFANGVLVSNCDAGLYGWRAALHFLHELPEEKVERDSPAFTAALEKRFEELVETRDQEKATGRAWWEPEEDFGEQEIL